MADGILKILDFDPYNKAGQAVVLPVRDDFVKKASVDLHPEILSFLSKNNVPDSLVRVVISALGAYDAYGPNKNGDAFYQEDLLGVAPEFKNVPMYRTYEQMGKAFRDHRNSDTDKAYGKVVLAVYNPVMRRVEIVCDISRLDAPDICGQIDNGKLPLTSMGFKASYDVCSICGNKAKSRSEYCRHALHEMLKIYPDGRMVYVRNPKGYFFDISFVEDPAEPISLVMRKVASHNPGAAVKLSAFRALEEKLTDPFALKKAIENKGAEIEKRVSADVEAASIPDEHKKYIMCGVPALKTAERRLPTALINDLATMSLKEAHATLSLFGIVPTPDEFQEMALKQAGMTKMALDLNTRNVVFEPKVSGDIIYPDGGNINHKIATKIAKNYPGVIENRSNHRPYLLKRALSLGDLEAGIIDSAVKTRIPYPKKNPETPPPPVVNNYYQNDNAAVDPELNKLRSANPMMALLALGGLYGALRWINRQSDTTFDRYLRKNPAVAIPVFGGTALLTALGQNAAERMVEKKGSVLRSAAENFDNSLLLRSLLGIPAMYSIAAYGDAQRSAGETPNMLVDSIREHPELYTGLFALGTAGAAGGLLKGINRMIGKVASAAREDVALAFEYPADLIDACIMKLATDYGAMLQDKIKHSEKK